MPNFGLNALDVFGVFRTVGPEPIRETEWINFRPIEVISIAQRTPVAKIKPKAFVASSDNVMGVESRVVGRELPPAFMAAKASSSSDSSAP